MLIKIKSLAGLGQVENAGQELLRSILIDPFSKYGRSFLADNY
jgi:hypothetical protein